MEKKIDTIKIKYRNLCNSKVPCKIEWIILAVICLLFLPSFFYNDIIATTRHSLNLWHCIADGNSIFDFYVYNTHPKNQYTYDYIANQTAAYPFIIYLILAIWDLPLFFIERFTTYNIFSNPLIVIYTKAVLVLVLIASVYIFKLICYELKWSKEKTLWAMFIYLSSSLVMTSLVIEGQYDIFSIFFTLLGILEYLRYNNKKFILWFSIALTFKFFALIIFIPLLLFKEKKVIKIIKSLLLTVTPLLIIKIIFKIFQSKDVQSLGLESLLLNRWLGTPNLTLGGFDIHFFFVFYFLLCIYSYFKIIKSNVLFKQYTIYISFLAYLIFFVFIPANPYWYLLILPFLTIIMFTNSKYFKHNIILEILGLNSLFLYHFTRIPCVYSPFYFIPTFIGKILKLNSNSMPLSHYYLNSIGFTPKYFHDFINYFGNKFGLTNFSFIFSMFVGSIFVTSLILIAIINNPIFILKINNYNKKAFVSNIVIDRKLIYTRIAITLILSTIPFLILMINYFIGTL